MKNISTGAIQRGSIAQSAVLLPPDMALRIFPFLVAKVSDAQDAARAKSYLELAAASLTALAVIRASSKHPQKILRSQPHDAEKWLGRCKDAFSGQDATAREAAAAAAAVVAVSKAEADKPLSKSEREQVSSDAKRDSRVSSLRADTTVSACVSIVANAIRVFTSHAIYARELPRDALGTIDTAHRCVGGYLCGGSLEKARNVFMSSLEADVKALTTGANTRALSDMPLWPAGEPEWAAANWAALRDGLSQAAGWSMWSRWYGDRLNGSISGDTPEPIFVGAPEGVWKEGSNAWEAYLQKSLTATIGDTATVPSLRKTKSLDHTAPGGGPRSLLQHGDPSNAWPWQKRAERAGRAPGRCPATSASRR